ncbi:V-set domain-containing T-cell activation inhibitor 1-like isoform X2 [Thalassophryne amazonica]|uniref:V-set domain-containing T-cell activation inhibitor 1-like isoform X2 n=1 Tax=Thalassophryne amazonica TaxID=390379 RepID=UPI001471AD43|nr:V-set domain-containing T-cell activation inhibitor 1-like isoform X2 [Thalassophryne amazonica]
MFVVFVFLLHVSHHALGVDVDVSEGVESVVLPCKMTPKISDDSTVTWRRTEPSMTVHVRRNNRDQPSEQNELYQTRTTLRPDALTSGNLSLTLNKPTKVDSATYNCMLRHSGELTSEEVRLTVRSTKEDELAKQRDIAAALAGIFGFVALGLAVFIATICMKNQKRRSLSGTSAELKAMNE